jgi:hypothetical protein
LLNIDTKGRTVLTRFFEKKSKTCDMCSVLRFHSVAVLPAVFLFTKKSIGTDSTTTVNYCLG